jgi:hypothetical protein
VRYTMPPVTITSITSTAADIMLTGVTSTLFLG